MIKHDTLQTVERALTFLEHVAAAPEAPNVREVAAVLGINLTTCYHLLRTLVACGYVQRQTDGSLVLGDKFGILFGNYRGRLNVDQRLSEIVSRLSERTSETAFLSVLDNDSVVLKVLSEGSQRLRVSGLYVGLRGNEYRRASGKAILSQLPLERRALLVDASLSSLPKADRSAARDEAITEINRTAEKGWSIDLSQSGQGIVSIGVAIVGSDGHVFGAIGVVTPTIRMDRLQDTYLEAVASAAAEATQLLQMAGTA